MRKKDQTAISISTKQGPVYTIWNVSPLSHLGTRARVFPPWVTADWWTFSLPSTLPHLLLFSRPLSHQTEVCRQGRDRDRDVRGVAGLSYSLGDWEETDSQKKYTWARFPCDCLKPSKRMQIFSKCFFLRMQLFGVYASLFPWETVDWLVESEV